MSNNINTHAGKAESYDLGRPEYPDTYFDFLYSEAGFTSSDIIADIGCGTGKITKHFLDRGNKLIAIEPDADMLRIADKKLRSYPNYSSFQRMAENIGLGIGSIDHIFIGNAYHWFDRKLIVRELKRILRDNGTIVIATLGNAQNGYDTEEITEKYKKDVLSRKPDMSAPFQPGTFVEKIFPFIIQETFDEFLHGLLSASYMPSVEDETYDPFCRDLKDWFDKHSHNDMMEVAMQLNCVIGYADNMA